MGLKITVTIISLNEEAFIGECIQSAWQIADEVIVVDSYSADKTTELAQSLGVKVYQYPFQSYGSQKNNAAGQAKNDWILNLDADERLDPQLVDSIKQLDSTASADAYAFSRKNFIGERWQKVWSPDYVIRLYDKRRCKFSEAIVHESINTQNFMKLPGNIIHYSFKDLDDCILRARKYSKLDALRLFEAGRKAKPWTPFCHGAFAFFKFFLLKKGVFYGADGLNASWVSALRSYLKYAYLLKMQQ